MLDFKSFLSNAKNAVTGLADQLKGVMDEGFAKGVMAGMAWMAAADGSIDNTEKKKVAAAIKMHPALQNQNPTELQKYFFEFAGMLEMDFDMGVENCRAAVQAISSNANQGEILMKLVGFVAAADGTVDDAEKDVLNEMSEILGVSA